MKSKKKCPVCGSEEYDEYEEFGVIDGDDDNEFKTPEWFMIKQCGNGCEIEGDGDPIFKEGVAINLQCNYRQVINENQGRINLS